MWRVINTHGHGHSSEMDQFYNYIEPIGLIKLIYIGSLDGVDQRVTVLSQIKELRAQNERNDLIQLGLAQI